MRGKARRAHNGKMRAVRLRHGDSATVPNAAPRSLGAAAAEKVRDAVREARFNHYARKELDWYGIHVAAWEKIFRKVHGRAPTSDDPSPAFDTLEWMTEEDRAWVESLREKARDYSRQANKFWQPDAAASDPWAEDGEDA